MIERPILFNGEMVRAILDGKKTQTRRPIKPACDYVQDWDKNDPSYGPYYQDEYGMGQKTVDACPFGQVSDRLWVRETFFGDEEWGGCFYRADMPIRCGDGNTIYASEFKWKPSIHMPRWASRITLEITGIRVERVQDISQRDARAEGGPPSHPSVDKVSRTFGFADFSRSWFGQTWNSIYAAKGYGWDVNPWVWVVKFSRVAEGGA